MNMKYVKRYWQILFLVGIISLTFGAVSHKHMTGISPNISMLNGMITGAGFAFTAVGAIKLLRNKRIPSEKLKAKEIELKDERNIELMRISLSISSTTASLLFAILAFVFIGMDYIIPGLICIVALYIQLASLFIAHKYYNSKI